MKSYTSFFCHWLLPTALLLLTALPASAQTVLLTESFDGGAGATPPAGWSTEQVSGTAGQVSFLPSGTHPTITPYDGSRLVEFNSWTATAGHATRLKRTLPVSTTGYTGIAIDFAWYEDPGYSASNDSVLVQWSTNGINWTLAGSFGRYNPVAGWKIKSVSLPTGASGQPTLYVAFLFRSWYGNNCHLDLMHLTGVQLLPNTGILSALAKNCYTNQPLAGALVTCNTQSATTNGSGQAALYNVPAGTQNATCSATGFLPQTLPVEILNQQSTAVTFCLDPTPAYLTGVITNMESGAPIVGAKVTSGGCFTYSTSGGYYTLHIYPAGTLHVTIQKAGFQDFVCGPLSFSCGNTEILDAQMMPMSHPPGEGTGTLNTSQTEVTLDWEFPEGVYELLYDDGIQDDFIIGSPGTKYAVRFTPVGYPAMVTGGKIHIGEQADYGTGTFPQPFQMAVYDASGPGGLPGQQIGELYDITPWNFEWVEFTFPPTGEIANGSFYLVMIPGSQGGTGVAADTTVPQLRSFVWPGATSGPWIPANGNLMMRALVEGSGGPVPPMDGLTALSPDPLSGNEPDVASGYRFWRLLWGEENTPWLWDSLGDGTIPHYTDTGWPALTCSPYRWACKALYASGNISGPSFSNILGKCWTASITVHTSNCCSLSTINPHPPAKITNTTVPDTSYLFVPDSTGYATIPNVWRGNYTLECHVFTCEAYIDTIDVVSDDTIYVIPGGPTPVPPSGLYVDDRSLLATWNAPRSRQTLFEETWQSGSYAANNWVEDPPNSNWSLATGFGNPSPSVQFSSSPLVTNYTHYLTSENVIPAMNAPAMYLRYDFYLNNFSSSTVESLATEVWDGSSWTQVFNWTNQTGSIPWTTHTVDLSAYTDTDIKIRFRASGEDSYNINQWNVDNIKVVAHGNLQDSIPCHLGYNTYLDAILGAFTYDTSYLIPPNLVQYGQTYTFCVNSVFTSGYSEAVCYTFTSEFLYPVRDLTATPLECAASLAWEKPEDQATGQPPIGLSGYNIYRFAYLHHHIGDPDSLSYLDLNLDPGPYYYEVTATYDLTPYGFPGETGESLLSAAPVIQVACGPILPFGEGWDNGTFTYNEWTFFPDQGNWNIGMADEGEAPWADFSWDPVQYNYHYELISRPLDATPWSCADVWLDLEVRLEDRFATGTEHLRIDLFCDFAWTTLHTLSNTGSTGWIPLHLDISQVSGKGFKIRFVAEGESSENILHWQVDNILLYGECLPPVNPDLTVSGQQVDLFWDPPQCNDLSGLEGYLVYRSDSSGSGPFQALTSTPVTDPYYLDEPLLEGMHWYVISAVFKNYPSGVWLCESAGADTLPALVVGVPGQGIPGVQIYPNPARDALAVESTEPINRIELFSLSGTLALTMELNHSLNGKVSLATVLPGTYLIRIITNRSAYHQKIVVTK